MPGLPQPLPVLMNTIKYSSPIPLKCHCILDLLKVIKSNTNHSKLTYVTDNHTVKIYPVT
jgi:hypothetical protein